MRIVNSIKQLNELIEDKYHMAYEKKYASKLQDRQYADELEDDSVHKLFMYYKLSTYLMSSDKLDKIEILNKLSVLGLDTVVSMVLHSVLACVNSTKSFCAIQEVIALLANKLQVVNSTDKYSEIQLAHIAYELIECCSSVRYWHIDITRKGGIILDVAQELTKTIAVDNGSYFLPPVAYQLSPATNNNIGFKYVKERAILGRFTTHAKQISLDVLDELQSLEFMLTEQCKNLTEPKTKGALRTERREYANRVLEMVEIKKDLPAIFHFGWQYDSRGRIYSHGYHLNPQGAEFNKAQINLNDPQQIT